MPSTCRTTDPSGIQFALACICLIHSSVIVATWSLLIDVSNYSNGIPSLHDYLQGVVHLLQILMIVQLSHHVAKAIHQPDLVIKSSLPHVFGLEVSIHDKSLAILPAIGILIRQCSSQSILSPTQKAHWWKHAHLLLVEGMQDKKGQDLHSVATGNGDWSHSTWAALAVSTVWRPWVTLGHDSGPVWAVNMRNVGWKHTGTMWGKTLEVIFWSLL